MAATAEGIRLDWLRRLGPSSLGLAGQTCTSWGVTGGLLAAMIVAGHIYAGTLSSSIGFLTTTIFFFAGSLIGFLHGGLLGYLGRPEGVPRLVALERIALGAFYSVPVLLTGWVVAMVLALSPAALLSGRYATFAATLIGWALAAGVFVWAWVETRRALGHLLRRWPDARAFLVTVGLALAALLPAFLVSRPEIWVLGMEPTSTAAALMALAASLWIVGPITALALLAWRAVRRPRSAVSGGGEVPRA